MAKGKKVRAKGGKARPIVHVNATVVATGGAPNSVAYALRPTDGPSQQYVTGPTTVEIPNSDPLYRIRFHLDDSGCSQNLRFRKWRPICALDGKACPTDGGIKTGQLKRSGAVEDKRLEINDYNYAEGPVSFALFFRDQKTNAPVNEFDPIIENGGGGVPPG